MTFRYNLFLIGNKSQVPKEKARERGGGEYVRTLTLVNVIVCGLRYVIVA